MRDAPPIISDFLTYMETIKGKSSNTVDEYALDLRMFFRYLVCKKKSLDNLDMESIDLNAYDYEFVKSINLSDIYDFLLYLARERKDKNATRARKIAAIRSYFKYLMTHKIIRENPASLLEVPKIKKSLPVHLSLDESVALLDSVDGKHHIRDYAIITLFLNCGIRLSELVGINMTDVYDEYIKVTGKGNKERIVYTNEACRDAIAEYVKVRPVDGVTYEHKNALFLSERKRRISTKTVQHLVKKFIAAAGLDTQRFSTHKLRHTAATLMFQHGNVDVRTLSEILGHAQLTTTQIYTHVSHTQLRDAANKNPLSGIKTKPRSKIKRRNTGE